MNRVILALVCFACCASIGVSDAASAEEARDGEYRWTGQAAGAHWSSPANWEVRGDEHWQRAATPPGDGAHVLLGDATEADEPQLIALDTDVRIARLTIDATGRRDYTLTSLELEDDLLDSNAGMLFTLALSDRTAIDQRAVATADLELDIETRLLHDGRARLRMHSAHAARVTLSQRLKAEAWLIAEGDGEGSTGILELRQPLSASRLVPTRGVRIFLNPSGGNGLRPIGGSSPIINADIQGSDGTILVRRDGSIERSIFQFGGTLRIALHEAGERDVTLTAGWLSRGGQIRLESPTDDSSGRLTLAVSTIAAGAGGGQPAPQIHLDAGTFLDLGRDQEAPIRASDTAGIHGEGGLIKTADRTRRIGASTTIGDRNTYTGGTFIGYGLLQLEAVTIPIDEQDESRETRFVGQLGPGPLHIAPGGFFDLNGLEQHVAGLHEYDGPRIWPAPEVRLNDGTLHLVYTEDATFPGAISGPGTLIVAGPGTQTLSAGHVGEAGQVLRVAGGMLKVDGELDIGQGILELAGGRIEADVLASRDRIWRLALDKLPQNQAMVRAAKVDITDASFELLSPDTGTGTSAGMYHLVESQAPIVGVTDERAFGKPLNEPFELDGQMLRLTLDTAGPYTLMLERLTNKADRP